MILLVTGSRSIKDYALVAKACDTFVAEACLRFAEEVEIKLLKHCDAPGVDRLCERWAKENGVPSEAYPAKWGSWSHLSVDEISLTFRPDGSVYNRLVGFNRNQEMIDSGFDAMLAIRCLGKSNGTDHCIQQAKLTGKPILLYKENGTYEWLTPNQKI